LSVVNSMRVVNWIGITLLCVLMSSRSPHQPDMVEIKTFEKIERIQIDSAKFAESRTYCNSQGFNAEIAFFSDMNLRSGRKRFFIVDLINEKVLHAGLVAHGHCQSYASIKPSFSNEVGSNCTSLGKYRVGYKYDGNYGTAYKLHGLEESNSNAFDRYVVLHSHDCVPDFESVVGICRSEGCPTVSPEYLARLEEVLDNSDKPVLLWVYSN
jgi:hypothetical protein